mgnify:CR=1 FL=1
MLAQSTDAGDAQSFSSLVQEAEEAGERRHGWTAAKQQRRAAMDLSISGEARSDGNHRLQVQRWDELQEVGAAGHCTCRRGRQKHSGAGI